MRRQPDVWIVIPAFNEGRMIARVLKELAGYPYNVVVVDDGSTDDTSSQAARFRVCLLRHVCNLGQGAALQTGITYALGFPETRCVVTYDSDGQHNAKDIPRLVRALRDGGWDVVLGSRFMEDGRAVNIGKTRRTVLLLALAFTRLSTRLKITDTHNGLRAFTAESAGLIALSQNGMAHASEILSQIARLKLRYREVPVTINYTPYSLSKGQRMKNSINVIWEMMKGRLK
jgi:polyprenyl-phospho-N-acetylgalactosaminyl synthase